MTAAEFRANPEFVRRMRTIFEDEIMVMALEVMAEEHPVRVVPSDDITPHFAAIQLGQNVGYETYDCRLKLLGKGIELPQTLPEPTYPPAEE